MEDPQFDTDFFNIFANLIENEEELDLLRKLLEGKDEEAILREFISRLEDGDNDQN